MALPLRFKLLMRVFLYDWIPFNQDTHHTAAPRVCLPCCHFGAFLFGLGMAQLRTHAGAFRRTFILCVRTLFGPTLGRHLLLPTYSIPPARSPTTHRAPFKRVCTRCGECRSCITCMCVSTLSRFPTRRSPLRGVTDRSPPNLDGRRPHPPPPLPPPASSLSHSRCRRRQRPDLPPVPPVSHSLALGSIN